MSHQREIVRDSNRIEAFGSFFSVLQECLGDSLPPKPEVLEIYGRILVNSFNIMDEEYQPLGEIQLKDYNRIVTTLLTCNSCLNYVNNARCR